jgi:isopenicillin-N epimerase
VRKDWAALFPLRSDLVMFNHASYGLATIELLEKAEETRLQLESDPNINLGQALQQRLTGVLKEVCDAFSLDPDRSALTQNATSGGAAVMRSLPLGPGDVVVVLTTEYSSIQRGWERRCAETGAEFRAVPVDVPLLDDEGTLRHLDALNVDRVAILQVSAVTSSTALRLPLERIAAWGHHRGAVVAVDAAHAPGHIPVAGWDYADVAFATLHKWLPVPRSVGIVWASSQYAQQIYPAEISLTWDADTLGARFEWPGTFDPAPRLVLPAAIHSWQEWAASGAIAHCEALAEYATEELTAAGAVPTGAESYRPPRLRAFILNGVPREVLREHVFQAGLRAWTGVHGDSSSLLRLATHVFNDEDDVDRLVHAVRAILHRPGAT